MASDVSQCHGEMIRVRFIEQFTHLAHVGDFLHRIFVGNIISQKRRMVFQFPRPCLKNGFDAFHSFKLHCRPCLRHSFRTLVHDVHEKFDSVFLCKIETSRQCGAAAVIRHGAVEPAFLEIFQDGFINSAAVESDGKERFSVYNRPAVFIDIAGIPAGFPLFHEQMKRLFRKNRFIFQVQEFYIDFHFSVGQIAVTDGAIYDIIDHYTREAGVRTLERRLAALCRKVAAKVVSGEATEKVTIKAADLPDYLGPRYITEDIVPKEDSIGLVNGLAWTAVGGELLQVETAVVPGTGKTITTGSLGNVMKESVTAAITYIRSVAEHYEIENTFYKDKDIHIHFPEGAVPKDGPSAGVTVCTAIVSALTGVSVRRDIAMTGEISLRGRVMRIGGLREKTMAALRHGVRTVIIPKDNERDLEEIDQTVRAALRFVTAETVDAVFAHALALPKKEAAVEHLTAMAGLERQEVRCGDQL